MQVIAQLCDKALGLASNSTPSAYHIFCAVVIGQNWTWCAAFPLRIRGTVPAVVIKSPDNQILFALHRYECVHNSRVMVTKAVTT